jgi:hypothetical protein
MVVLSISDSLQRTSDEFFAWLPKLVGALVILFVGWLIARFVARIVKGGLRSAGADRALASGRAAAYKQQFAPSLEPSGVIGTVVFWFIFGWAILLAISTLGIQALQNAVASVVAYLPNVVAAILILLVAIAFAGAVGALAARLAGKRAGSRGRRSAEGRAARYVRFARGPAANDTGPRRGTAAHPADVRRHHLTGGAQARCRRSPSERRSRASAAGTARRCRVTQTIPHVARASPCRPDGSRRMAAVRASA